MPDDDYINKTIPVKKSQWFKLKQLSKNKGLIFYRMLEDIFQDYLSNEDKLIPVDKFKIIDSFIGDTKPREDK